MKEYKFHVGQKVIIRAGKYPSIEVAAHAGEIVTIKALCPFTWAYELEELDGLWNQNCFKEVR